MLKTCATKKLSPLTLSRVLGRVLLGGILFDCVLLDGALFDAICCGGCMHARLGASPLRPREAAAADPKSPDSKTPDPKSPAAPQPGALDLDDPVEPLTPLKPRSEKDADRVQAEGLFTAARVAEQKQDFPAALRLYQRAYRCDPHSAAALREIPPLAFSLDRPSVAVRYAVMTSDTETMEPITLRRLALALTENGGSNDQVLRLLERLEKIEAHEKPSANQVVMWMQLGRLRFLDKQYAAAAESFAHVLKALEKPQDFGLDDSHRQRIIGKGDMTYLLFGETFLEAGRLDEALAAFEKANSITPREGVLAYHQARVAEKKHQPAAALEYLQKFFDKHPSGQGIGPYELLARLLKETGKADQLDSRLEQLLAADANNTPLTFFAAKHYEDTQQWDKAEPLFLKLLDADPRKTPAEALEGLVDVYRHKHDTAALLETLGNAAGRGDNLASLDDQMKLLAAEPDTLKALAELVRSQTKPADEPDSNYGRPLAVALLALEAKDTDLAGEFFKTAITAGPEKKAEIILTWGLGLLMADKTPQAVKVLRRAVDEQVLPDNPAFEFYLAGALELDGRTDEAIAVANVAAEARKDSARFQARPAWILYHAKRYAAAREIYEDVLKKFDSNYDSEDIRESLRETRAALSNIEVIEHHMSAAEEWLEQILDEFPENIGAMNDLGYLWADENKHLDRALGMIQKAVKEEPKNMAYLDSLGWVLFRLGRYAEAVEPLKAATTDPKADPTVFDHLGDVQEKAGDLPGAIQSWQKALTGLEEEKEKQRDADKIRLVREKLERVHAPIAPAREPKSKEDVAEPKAKEGVEPKTPSDDAKQEPKSDK